MRTFTNFTKFNFLEHGGSSKSRDSSLAKYSSSIFFFAKLSDRENCNSKVNQELYNGLNVVSYKPRVNLMTLPSSGCFEKPLRYIQCRSPRSVEKRVGFKSTQLGVCS